MSKNNSSKITQKFNKSENIFPELRIGHLAIDQSIFSGSHVYCLAASFRCFVKLSLIYSQVFVILQLKIFLCYSTKAKLIKEVFLN